MENQEESPTAQSTKGPEHQGGQGQPPPRLLEQVRNVMRLHHYSIHTERSYIDWIKRYIHFHHMRTREDLASGESKIEAFCTDLAVAGKVAASTQNQAFNALVFLYRQVLKVPLEEKINAIRVPVSEQHLPNSVLNLRCPLGFRVGHALTPNDRAHWRRATDARYVN
jgi:Phage integrase, N-terminal SAM-like domain